ncbi:hypothetical protein [Streptacidiphilus neutrinimicus]|uniref:hypothetical protein n=1 Tax=Streptacidiphilus neutrinimicus TaxID=105420 RepID=UPI0005A91DD0|nr:hypothetical protein [Streptacidiphilus neutrinimicus]
MTAQPLPAPPRRWWSIYLNDHLTGASAGVRLARRLADSVDESARPDVRQVAHEIAEDREALLAIMAELGVRAARRYAVAGMAAEYIGRLKPNGRLLRRSPLAPLIECEAMLAGVQGKLQVWQALAAAGPRLVGRTDLETLQSRARRQVTVLERLHQHLAADLAGLPRPPK